MNKDTTCVYPINFRASCFTFKVDLCSDCKDRSSICNYPKYRFSKKAKEVYSPYQDGKFVP